MNDPGVTLAFDAILAEARQRANGLDDFGEGPFLAPLQLLLDSLEKEGRLNAIGRVIARERVLGHTVNRLNYVADRTRFPGIAREQIVAPVFIIGMPRTGTTILHDILAHDPDTRAPLTWETMFPSPPAGGGTFDSDPRIERGDATFPSVELLIPAFKAMHPMGAELSQECVMMMGESMCTPLFHNQFRVPTYQDWVDHDARLVARLHLPPPSAPAPAVAQPPRALGAEDRRAHVGPRALLETYPDACVVFTHRDPVKSLTSYASLTSLVRDAWERRGRSVRDRRATGPRGSGMCSSTAWR